MTPGLFRRYTWLLAAVPLCITGCGKKGPLIYPDLLVPAAPTDLEARQTGSAVRLSFALPSKDMAGRRYDGLTEVRVVRRTETTGQPPVCTACSDNYAPLRTIDLRTLPSDIERYGSLVMLLDGNVATGRRYSYRVTAIGGEGIQGGTSAPAAAVVGDAPLPPVLQVVNQPTEINLEFVGLPPEQGAIAGYQVYRSVKGMPQPLQPLTSKPVSTNRYTDQGLDRNTTYVYGVRTVAVRNGTGEFVESDLSNLAEGRLKDDE